MRILTAVGAFFLSFGISLYTVRLMRKMALKWNVLDAPDGTLKTQKQPVPYLGGAGVYIAILITLALITEFSPQVVSILLGASIIVMVGLIDDFEALRPSEKMLGQVLAAIILIRAGVRTDIEFFASAPQISLLLNVVLSLFWYLTVINALNLIDVSDGLCGSVTFAASVVFAALAIINGSWELGLVALTLAGAVLGFLFYNWQPARIYLGDTGSMLLGLILAALTVLGRYSINNRVSYLGALFILGVPLFDTTLITIARLRKGKSPFRGGPEHFAIRLKRKKNLSSATIAILASSATLLAGAAAVWSTFLSETAAASLLGVIALLGIGLLVWFLSLQDDE